MWQLAFTGYLRGFCDKIANSGLDGARLRADVGSSDALRRILQRCGLASLPSLASCLAGPGLITIFPHSLPQFALASSRAPPK